MTAQSMSAQPPLQRITEAFAAWCGSPPAVVARAPGRVNLIGEHTDYNDGFVLPMALEQATWVAARPRSDEHMHARALEMEEEATWALAEWKRAAQPDWTSYVAGVAALLRKDGAELQGADVLIYSDVPVGGGLSSSAALEVAAALALAQLAGYAIGGRELADLCRAAEHEYAGVPCGIMDQYVSVLAEAGCAFLLDCRKRSWEHLPLDMPAHVVAVINSGVRHKLAGGEYAKRQEQCREAVRYFQGIDPNVQALRDLTITRVEAERARLGPEVYARALHVVTENRRTEAAAVAIRNADLSALGRLMAESHASLRDDYEVSCRELDLLVELVSEVDGVVGARMTGGGFGGCIVAIARRDAVPAIADVLQREYDGAGLGPSQMITSRPGAGAGLAQ